MPYYYFDWTYVVLVLPCVLLSLWASANVNSTFRKYSQQYSSRRLTGAEAAQRVLSANGVYGVRIERISGNLTDHYDPRTNVIRLSDSVYDNTSTAAIGVACHEAGHAVQYAESYAPIKLRAAIIPVTNIGSKLAMPLILEGLRLSAVIGLATATIGSTVAAKGLGEVIVAGLLSGNLAFIVQGGVITGVLAVLLSDGFQAVARYAARKGGARPQTGA